MVPANLKKTASVQWQSSHIRKLITGLWPDTRATPYKRVTKCMFIVWHLDSHKFIAVLSTIVLVLFFAENCTVVDWSNYLLMTTNCVTILSLVGECEPIYQNTSTTANCIHDVYYIEPTASKNENLIFLQISVIIFSKSWWLQTIWNSNFIESWKQMYVYKNSYAHSDNKKKIKAKNYSQVRICKTEIIGLQF